MLLVSFFTQNSFLIVFLFMPFGCFSQDKVSHDGRPSPESMLYSGNGPPPGNIPTGIFPKVKTLLDSVGILAGVFGPQVTGLINIAKIGLGIVETLYTIFKEVFGDINIDFSFLESRGLEKELLTIYEMIDVRLEQIQRGIVGTQSSLRALVKGLPHLVRWEIAMDTVESYILPINNLYHRFVYYQKHKQGIENRTLIEFAESVVSHDTHSIQSYMATIHSMISPNDPPVIGNSMPQYSNRNGVNNPADIDIVRNMETLVNVSLGRYPSGMESKSDRKQNVNLRPSIFNLLEEAIQNYESCSHKQSPQQLMFGLYTTLALTQARGYVMIRFSLDLLRYFKKGTFTIERQLAEELYIHYSKALMKIGKEIISRADNSYRKCDPSTHKEGETFEMMTELLQGYIENEVDMSSHGSCGNECHNFKHSKVEGCYLPDKSFCGKQRRCMGTVHDCRFFDSKATVCVSPLPYRRYDWVKFDYRKSLGHENTCLNEMKVHSWWRFFFHCSYCMCLCDDASSITSDRFVSLRPAVSDANKNNVVTGVRFTKRNRILHIEIQEGTAMAQGQVEPESLKWVDVEPIVVGAPNYREGTDYVTLTYETRKIDLDYLKAPKDYVVTGLKFRMLGQHVNLEMWVTPIDFKTGILSADKSFWVSSDSTPEMKQNPRLALTMEDPDDPRKSVAQSEVDSTFNMYVTIQATSMDSDVAQLTVPFFDAQPVTPMPMLWFGGVQLYHRGSPGFGGFIAFRLFNYNLTRYLETMDDELV